MAFWNSPSGTSASGADLVTNGGWAALATPIEGLASLGDNPCTHEGSRRIC
jgi:hypothetical protein